MNNTFQRARTNEQIQTRLEEIIDACEEIYDTEGYEAINIKAIGEKISCTRPAIYKYFHTKEEILMEILSREFTSWKDELEDAFHNTKKTDEKTFCEILTTSLEHRMKLLELMSLYLKEIENGCRLEKVVEFKKEARSFFDVFYDGIHTFFPDTNKKKIHMFTQSFMLMVHGIYSYIYESDKQKEAKKLAGMSSNDIDFHAFCFNNIKALATQLH